MKNILLTTLVLAVITNTVFAANENLVTCTAGCLIDVKNHDFSGTDQIKHTKSVVALGKTKSQALLKLVRACQNEGELVGQVFNKKTIVTELVTDYSASPGKGGLNNEGRYESKSFDAQKACIN